MLLILTVLVILKFPFLDVEFLLPVSSNPLSLQLLVIAVDAYLSSSSFLLSCELATDKTVSLFSQRPNQPPNGSIG